MVLSNIHGPLKYLHVKYDMIPISFSIQLLLSGGSTQVIGLGLTKQPISTPYRGYFTGGGCVLNVGNIFFLTVDSFFLTVDLFLTVDSFFLTVHVFFLTAGVFVLNARVSFLLAQGRKPWAVRANTLLRGRT